MLLACMALATLSGIASALWRMIRGPDRWPAALAVVAILPPIALWVYVGLTARWNWSHRKVPNTLAMRTAKVMGATFMRLDVEVNYRQRLESDKIVMYYDPRRSSCVEQVEGPEDDLAAMDRHLERLEYVLGDSIRGKVYWIRGPALGSEYLSLHGLALGSCWSPESPDGYRGDRHELAHAALDSLRTPQSNPPYVLHEGWATAQCGDSRWELAKAAAEARAEYPQLSLRELFGSAWYYEASGPVYSIGGAFVDFLIRTYDGQRFRRFYIECTPQHFDSACEQIFQRDFDSLETAF
jgi:hypothetical protein